MLVSKSPNHIHQGSQRDAENNAGHDGEVESSVPATINHVTRKTADGKIRASQKEQGHPRHQQNSAKENQQFPEVCH